MRLLAIVDHRGRSSPPIETSVFFDDSKIPNTESPADDEGRFRRLSLSLSRSCSASCSYSSFVPRNSFFQNANWSRQFALGRTKLELDLEKYLIA